MIVNWKRVLSLEQETNIPVMVMYKDMELPDATH